MRKLLLVGAAVAALAFPLAAQADEAEILAHYDAYEAAMAQLQYGVADQEADAAWRAAEAEWGGVEDTAVLAFNLVRLRLMGDRRAEATEAALRVAELSRTGNAQSVTPAEVALFTTLAQFDAVNGNRGAIDALQRALEDYSPTDYVAKRIALLGWSYVATGRARLEQHRPALEAVERAEALLAEDPTAPVALHHAVALVAAQSGYNIRRLEPGLDAVARAVAAFPAQPAGQTLDPQLVTLLLWDSALKGLWMGEERRPYMGTDPALMNPAWDDGRYVTENVACMIMWEEPPMPDMRGPRPETMGAVFEYRLSADGRVTDLVTLGADSHPFADALLAAKAPPPAPECQGGLYHQVVAFIAPRPTSSGARN